MGLLPVTVLFAEKICFSSSEEGLCGTARRVVPRPLACPGTECSHLRALPQSQRECVLRDVRRRGSLARLCVSRQSRPLASGRVSGGRNGSSLLMFLACTDGNWVCHQMWTSARWPSTDGRVYARLLLPTLRHALILLVRGPAPSGYCGSPLSPKLPAPHPVRSPTSQGHLMV